MTVWGARTFEAPARWSFLKDGRGPGTDGQDPVVLWLMETFQNRIVVIGYLLHLINRNRNLISDSL